MLCVILFSHINNNNNNYNNNNNDDDDDDDDDDGCIDKLAEYGVTCEV